MCMGKLSSMPGRLGALPGRLSFRRDDQGHDVTVEPWRRWFNTARWKRLRLKVFERDLFTCQCGCGVIEPDTSKLVGDHIIPHRGDPRLFWDDGNVQTLRKSPCHDEKKQREEYAARMGIARS